MEIYQRALKIVPDYLRGSLDVFSKRESDKLPPLHGMNHHIDLEEGKRLEDLKYSLLYKMTLEELEACRQYVTDNLRKGFIAPSSAL